MNIQLLRVIALASFAFLTVWADPVTAQITDVEMPTDPEPVIETLSNAPSDADIERRLSGIYSEIEGLESVTVSVREGVVILAGEVAGDTAAQKAEALALRIEGVVVAIDEIDRSRAISTNVSPMVASLQKLARDTLRSLPLIGVAIAVFALIALLTHLLVSWSGLWRRILPNPFLAELVAQAVRIAGLIVALVVSLNLVGATALMGAILGGAGVLGLAIGFAVRDGLENYISSVMLSIRQPFRANEHVVIDGQEGKVVRLTSRATILMTLDGNHLRIPNSNVFKAVILNYTRNPERRLSFELGVDANDDPLAAIQTGVDIMTGLGFILDEPGPFGIINKVGDSNIVICFFGWVDQDKTDFGKARGVAIARVKDALEAGGFSLPEPIYRLRIDDATGTLPVAGTVVETAEPHTPLVPDKPSPPGSDDVTPDRHLDEKVSEERAEQSEPDLLDQDRPVE